MRSLYTLLASYVRCHFISNIHFIYVAIAIHNVLSIINRYVHTPKYQYVTISGVHNGDYHNTHVRFADPASSSNFVFKRPNFGFRQRTDGRTDRRNEHILGLPS